MKQSILTALIFMLFANCVYSQPKVKTGIEVLRERNFDILKGKRVGLITNPTGVDSRLKSTADILFEASEVNLVALYAPEHGIRGNFTAGHHLEDERDEKTNLPVYSLHGKLRKPTPEILAGIDILVYDIQDIGSRSYTYISTLGLAMEAAAENNIEFAVLDRPNPLGGEKIEGVITRSGFFSFVSQFAIPYVHGLTTGELAKFLNYEKMLNKGVQCKLSVVEMQGWTRDMNFIDTKLPWIMSSPHIPHVESTFFYPISGILGELYAYNIGIGYTLPFEVFAGNNIDADKLANDMNALNLPGLIFRPIHFRPYYSHAKDTEQHGVQIHIIDYKKAPLSLVQFYFLQEVRKQEPNKNIFNDSKSRINMFDKVCGSDEVRIQFTKNYKVDDIKEIWYKDIPEYKKRIEQYLIYKSASVPQLTVETDNH
ncbi:MAG: DUF1343 domain-containing protein [Prevotellaceae bacterium]|jgi:uncharacterized protein YbbC (DUF1343 family)|nr:DUF1343 domain-containing protein [Prevotellaceae bacterium]